MKIIKSIIKVILCIAIAYIISPTHIFSIITLLAILGIAFLILFIILIKNIISKQKHNLKNITFLLIFVSSSFLFSRYKFSVQLKTANNIIFHIEKYYAKYGFYPSSLKTIGQEKHSKNFLYYNNSNETAFKIRYIVDGWHYKEYNSKTKQWTAGD